MNEVEKSNKFKCCKRLIVKNCKQRKYLTFKELRNRVCFVKQISLFVNFIMVKIICFQQRLKSYYEIKNVDDFFKLLQKNENILFGRESSGDKSLFEDILRTNNHDHAEFIRKIWIEFELWKNENILTTVSLFFLNICNDYGHETNIISVQLT